MNGKTICAISGKEYPIDKVVPLSALDQNLQRYIFSTYNTLNKDSYIGEDQLITIKGDYLNGLLASELGELDALEQEMVKSISKNRILSERVEESYEDTYTFGERVADLIAEFGGSWKFILIFLFILIGWIIFNVTAIGVYRFDPYPFILMNLFLSSIAALQAPIIMMSQNRQQEIDRMNNENDYLINLKAEMQKCNFPSEELKQGRIKKINKEKD